MKLVLYSGGTARENKHLDKKLLSLVESPSPSITFIPASSYDADIEFRDFVAHYNQYSLIRFMLLPVDIPVDHTMLELALKSDIIHLGGGNTYHFLSSLRKSKLLGALQKFVQRGGVLSGLSAGAIMMTPSIDTAGYPKFDCDPNDVHLKNLKSLNFINIDFFPHYKFQRRYDQAFLKWTKNRSRALFACPDGSGIVIEGSTVTFVGPQVCFYKGEKYLIDSSRKRNN